MILQYYEKVDKNATENQAKTLNEYEDELNKYISETKEYKLADKVKVGDYVKAGQTVSAGTQIGDITTSLDGSYTLDFQIWNDTNPVDPMGWVSY